jgi:hypothetical protein
MRRNSRSAAAAWGVSGGATRWWVIYIWPVGHLAVPTKRPLANSQSRPSGCMAGAVNLLPERFNRRRDRRHRPRGPGQARGARSECPRARVPWLSVSWAVPETASWSTTGGAVRLLPATAGVTSGCAARSTRVARRGECDELDGPVARQDVRVQDEVVLRRQLVLEVVEAPKVVVSCRVGLLHGSGRAAPVEAF